MNVRISLATKCQLLFGAAVVLILTAALAVCGLRMRTLVWEGQQHTARRLMDAWWTAPDAVAGATVTPAAEVHPPGSEDPIARYRAVRQADFTREAERDPLLARAIEHFHNKPEQDEYFTATQDRGGHAAYRYLRAVREGTAGDAAAAEIAVILSLDMRSALPHRQLMLNQVYVVAAGLFAGLLAIGVFWFITTRIILSPVRVLRETAAKISEGDINIRSDINTGDEFEQLSNMFNTMVENLKTNQDQLRGINKSLDLKLGELAETNVSLYEANKIKGEFLANVSHELRTPLNSIIGFAEVLAETVDNTQPASDKYQRYINNIITSSRRLLDLINDLLDLAKIEAGRMELRVSGLSIADTAEGLINLIRPQAEKGGIQLVLKVPPNLPMVQTDPGKLQQIIFNFLSNAVKFTPVDGTVTLLASLEETAGAGQSTTPKMRISVRDTGPGIPVDSHEQVFEKFTQLDSTVTRTYGGTGLGLTISRDLAALLQGQIELDSDEGRGATFSLIIPLSLESRDVPLMPDLVDHDSDAHVGDAV